MPPAAAMHSVTALVIVSEWLAVLLLAFPVILVDENHLGNLHHLGKSTEV